MTATINRKTRKGELETGTDGSSQTRQNPRVDGYGYGFGPPRICGSGFWTGLEPNRSVFPIQTQTAGGLPGPVANTIPGYPAAVWVGTDPKALVGDRNRQVTQPALFWRSCYPDKT